MSVRALLAASVLLVAAAPPPSPAEAGRACTAPPPAGLAGPARWFGPCPRGQAEGMGVLRTGSAQPFGFFAGRMSAGRPGAGLVIQPNGLFAPAAGFARESVLILRAGGRRRSSGEKLAVIRAPLRTF